MLNTVFYISASCPYNIPVRWRGHCYTMKYFTEPYDYNRAQGYCRSLNADLVWILDRTEQRFIESRFLLWYVIHSLCLSSITCKYFDDK